MTKTVRQFATEVADREAIRECIFVNARGVDRCDEDLLRQSYWPDATDEHLDFVGNREEYIRWAMPLLRGMDQTQHLIGNILIRIDGDHATAETYFQAYHRVTNEGRCFDVISSGRYTDQFEKRNDIWRVLKRIAIIDWFREFDDSADWSKGILGMSVQPGSRYPDDISYAFLENF